MENEIKIIMSKEDFKEELNSILKVISENKNHSHIELTFKSRK